MIDGEGLTEGETGLETVTIELKLTVEPHVPNADWHPVPQWSEVVPHQPY